MVVLCKHRSGGASALGPCRVASRPSAGAANGPEHRHPHHAALQAWPQWEDHPPACGRNSGSYAGGPGREDDPPERLAGSSAATCGAAAGSAGGRFLFAAQRRAASTGPSRGPAFGKQAATEASIETQNRSPSLRCASVRDARERTTKCVFVYLCTEPRAAQRPRRRACSRLPPRLTNSPAPVWRSR